MKLFLIGWAHMRPEMVDAALEMQKHHEILYWVRMEDVFQMDKTLFPKTVFHNYKDALKGIPAAEVKDKRFMPLGKKRINDFSQMEAEILTMMEKWYENWSVNQKKDFYYKLLDYWNGILELYKPETIIFSEVPHEIYTFVIYNLAKSKAIRTIMFENIMGYDRLLPFEDYKVGNESVLDASKKNFPDNISVDDLSESSRDYYLEQTGKKDKSPVYMRSFKSEHVGLRKFIRLSRSMWPFVKDLSIFERATIAFFRLFKSSIKQEYSLYIKQVDYSKKYVYLALHYQPERTTSPQGDIYVDQLLMIRTVSASLPSGWVLYVKEHPNQWLPHGSQYTPYRYRNYYKEISELPNVELIPVETSTFELIKYAKAVVTATGIPGIEAIFRGIPAIIFGYPWYMHAPGAFRVSSTSDCSAAFSAIQSGYTVDNQKVLNYVGVLDKASFNGYFDPYGHNVAKFSDKENFSYIFKAILDFLNQ